MKGAGSIRFDFHGDKNKPCIIMHMSGEIPYEQYYADVKKLGWHFATPLDFNIHSLTLYKQLHAYQSPSA